MKILVTGALGHIGSMLIRDLVQEFEGCNIIMVDNMMTQRYCSLFNLPKSGNYSFIESDITKINLNNLLNGVDIVVHLAAITDAARSFDRADEVEENNYNATKLIAEACVDLDIKLITLSSTSVYGTQKSLVDENCTEEDLKPQSPYATTKLKEEELVKNLVINKGLKASIYRFGTIFGASPGIRFHTAVNKFCWQAAMGIPITVWTTAYDQQRPYLCLKDACRAVAHIIKKDLFNGDIYNVLTVNATVRDVVDTIRMYIPSLDVKFVDHKIMNQLSYEVSCEKFAKTGFKVTGSLQRSISEES